ncbi:hypothetical protein ACFC0S_16435 [Streptomyces sp. NPDC056084]|uniref:hypothetical protein n=1 Tax=unclassified Streptomyces TaxID=2593676 RepID=UPI0035E1E12C
MDRSTPRPRPVPGAIVGYVNGRPVRVIAGGSGEDDPALTPEPQPVAPAAPAPTPADLAAKHSAQAAEADAADAEENVTVTQKRMSLLLTREKDQGRQAALRALAADAGLDPDTIDATQLKQVLAEARALKEAQLSDEQRREAEFDRREQAVAAKENEAARALAAAQTQLQEVQRTAALVGLGAADEDLEDALVLLDKALKDSTDPDTEVIAEAAKDLKKRRPALFGAAETVTPKPIPAAPSGSPAGGTPRRQAAVGKPGDAGRRMAARMFGGNTADAA